MRTVSETERNIFLAYLYVYVDNDGNILGGSIGGPIR